MSTEEKNIQNQQEVEDKLLIDHDYDGIKELSNRPPPWLMMIFYGTIIWSVFYVFHYHILKTGPSQEEEYQQEMAEAAEMYKTEAFDENNITLITDNGKLSKALITYTKACGTCHGGNGEGGIGPNLTDKYWLHGNTPEDVFKTIKNGVPNTSMMKFGNTYSDKDILLLTSYVLVTLKGTNPANAKAPEGEAYE
jgi:cytochrome c oxidase cbb3-type subunit 3